MINIRISDMISSIFFFCKQRAYNQFVKPYFTYFHMNIITNYTKIYVFLIALLALICPCISQTAFLEDFPMEFEIREIEGVVELANGNYCMILREDDMSLESSRIQSVYLFDQCGKYIDRIQFLNIDEYIDFYNVTVFQDKILMLGYFDAGDYLMMLDPDDLSIVNEKYHFDWDYKNVVVNEEQNRVGHLGAYSDFMNYSTYDEDLERVIDLGTTIEEDDLRWIQLTNATGEYFLYDKVFDNDNSYNEIGIADYSLNEIGIISGTSIHGNLSFGKKVFVDDSTFYTTVSYELDEGLYYRKYILDSMLYEIAINPLSQIGRGIYYEVEDDQVNVYHTDKFHRIYDIETANLLSEKQILPDGSIYGEYPQQIIKTNDGGLLFADDHWTYIDNVWKSYIRLIKLNSNLELDLVTPSPCMVSADEVTKNDVILKIDSNTSLGSFSLISNEKLSLIELYDASGNIVNAVVEPMSGKSYQISTEAKGLVVVIAKLDNGSQVAKKVIIY